MLDQKPETFSLVYVDTKVGTGPLAEPHKWYTVHYTGYLPDGTKFDSSVDRGQPISFPYGAHRVIEGWDTGFEGMRIGGKRRLFVPYQLGYGENGHQPDPAKAELVFDVELIAQSDTQPAPPKPPTAHASDRRDSAGRGHTCSEADADASGHGCSSAGESDHAFELHATGSAVHDEPAEELTGLRSPLAPQPHPTDACSSDSVRSSLTCAVTGGASSGADCRCWSTTLPRPSSR